MAPTQTKYPSRGKEIEEYDPVARKSRNPRGRKSTSGPAGQPPIEPTNSKNKSAEPEFEESTDKEVTHEPTTNHDGPD